MFRTNAPLPVAAAAIAVAMVVAACGSGSSTTSSSAGPQPQAQSQQKQQAVIRFADCVRLHGVPGFPDPTTNPHAFKNAVNTQAPAFKAAATACQHLLPNGGGPNQSAAPSQAQIAAELAFARCIRSHGFPNFPDPSSTGQLSHEMLANAGI